MSNFAMRDLHPGLTEQAKGKKKQSDSEREQRKQSETERARRWTPTVSRLQAGAVEGNPPDAVELKGGNLLVVGQAASSAPAQSHRGLAEVGPARFTCALTARVMGRRQLPADVQVSRKT